MSGVPKFTRMQMESLLLCGKGLSDKDIAKAQNCSHRTVEKRMEIIRRKLEVGTRVEAAVWAAKQGLL